MDTFFKTKPLIEYLKRIYKRHESIIIFYDLDRTVFESYDATDCGMVRQLIRDLRPYAKLVCFTARDTNNPKVEKFVRRVLEENDVPYDYINRTADGLDFCNVKPYFNCMIDDKSVIGQTYEALQMFLKWVREYEKEK